MAILVNHWTRRDDVGLEAFGDAAYQVCRAARDNAEVGSCRFYWVDAHHIVIQYEAESFEALDRPGTAQQAKAAFGLTDLARAAGTERWQEPRVAMEGYRLAGR